MTTGKVIYGKLRRTHWRACGSILRSLHGLNIHSARHYLLLTWSWTFVHLTNNTHSRPISDLPRCMFLLACVVKFPYGTFWRVIIRLPCIYSLLGINVLAFTSEVFPKTMVAVYIICKKQRGMYGGINLLRMDDITLSSFDLLLGYPLWSTFRVSSG